MSSRTTPTPASSHDAQHHPPSVPHHPSPHPSDVQVLLSPKGKSREEDDIGMFSGQPMGEVPSPLPEVEDLTHISLPTYQLREEVEANDRLAWRKNAMLNIMHQAMPSHFRLPRYNLDPAAKGTVQSILEALGHILCGIPIRTHTGEVGYYISPSGYNYFLDYLASLQKRSIPMLLAQGQGVPPLPKWGPRGKPTLIWSLTDFEFLAILFRDDVENYLAFLYDRGALFLESPGSTKSPLGPMYPKKKDGVSFYSPPGHSPPASVHVSPTPFTGKPREPTRSSTPVVYAPTPQRSTDTFVQARC